MPGLGRRRYGEPRVLDASRAYAEWAPGYPPYAHNRLMELEQQAVLGLLPDCGGRVVLDLGCGSGRYARLLIARGARRVVGVDQSADMLLRTRGSSALLVRADARALPLTDASIDLAVSGLMVGDVKDLDGIISGVARVLRPGGYLVYSDLHPDGAEAGWRRLFTGRDGATYAVRHHVHRLSDHLAACRRAGLGLERVIEPVIDFDHPARGRPAAVVVRARREP